MWNKKMIRSVTSFFFSSPSSLMAHNVIKADCHYLQIRLAVPQRTPNEKCSLIIRGSWILYSFSCVYLVLHYTPSLFIEPPPASSTLTPFFFLLFSPTPCYCYSFVCWCVCNFFCLSFLDLFVSRPVGRFLTGVALVEPFPRLQKPKRETGSVTLCGALSPAHPAPPALIESSDPKLMRRGAGAHLLSTARVLHKQTGEPQWQCWIRSACSDIPPSPTPFKLWHTWYLFLCFAIVLKELWVVRTIAEMFAKCQRRVDLLFL